MVDLVKVRILTAAVGAAVTLLLMSCDSASVSPSGRVWVIDPDVAMHKAAGHHVMEASGQCGNGSTTWIARNVFNIDFMTEAQTILVDCGPGGYAVGSWGLVAIG
jgi:hypothetical protein